MTTLQIGEMFKLDVTILKLINNSLRKYKGN